MMFLENSSVHGLKYLTPQNRAVSERVLWLGLIFACMVGATLFSLSTWRRYQDNPTVISMERDYKAWNTSFPSVTICPHNKYNNSAKAENRKDMQDVIPYLVNASYENFHQLQDSLPEEIFPPEQYMELIINNSLRFIHVTDADYPFTTSITEMGVCYTYFSNIAIYNSPEKWRSGNRTIVKNNNELHINPLQGEFVFRLWNMSSGSKVYFHNAFEMPDSSSHFMDLKYLHQLTVEVVVSLAIHSTEGVRSLSKSQRKCRFLEESDLHISPVYSYNLCRMQCRVDQAMQLCGCVPHFYRSKVKYPACSFEGMRCLGHYKARLVTLRDDEKRLCNCLPQCDDVSYAVAYEEQIQWELGTNLVLHLSKYPRMRFKRDLIYGFTDVLVAIGASAGLFLGCSILSFIEIIYFFTLRLFWFTYNGRFKVFWLAACSASVYGCCQVWGATMEAFQQRAISFVPETTYLHWNTGFPAATVCEKLDNGKIWDLAKRINPSADISAISKMTTYLRQMIFYGGKCSDCNRHCSNSAMCPTDILDFVKEVLANCTTLLGDCYWNGVKFECCDEFYPYLTPYGICYAINSLQTMKKNVTIGQRVDLISNMATGPGQLEFKVFVDAELYVHSPEDAFHLGQEAEPDLRTYSLGKSYTIYFRITEIENDPHISSLSLSQRGCILPHENPLTMYDIYSSSACISECQAKAQLQLCGCVHHYTPQIAGASRTCDLAGIMCIDGYADALSEITSMGSPELNVSCDCTTPGCTEPEYTMIPVVTTELDTAAWSHFRLEMLALPTVRYRRNVIRSKLDIVVSTGGAAGFFLGASLISVVELIMYFCIRIIPRNHPPNNIRN